MPSTRVQRRTQLGTSVDTQLVTHLMHEALASRFAPEQSTGGNVGAAGTSSTPLGDHRGALENHLDFTVLPGDLDLALNDLVTECLDVPVPTCNFF